MSAHHRRQNHPFAALLVVLLPTAAFGATPAWTEQEALAAIEAARQERLANAVPLDLWGVLPVVEPGDKLSLVLNNAFGADLTADVDLLSSGGNARTLGSIKVPASRHRSIDLGALLAAPQFSGMQAVRVSYPGDIEMFQAWFVRDGAGGTEEILFRSGTQSASRELSLFWDSAWLPGPLVKKEVAVLNSSSVPLEVEASFPGSAAAGFTFILQPKASRRLELPRSLARGIFVLSHQGPPGSLLAFAALATANGRLNLPVSGSTASPEKNSFAALRLSADKSFFALANMEAGSQLATLGLYDPATGGLLAAADRVVAANGIDSFDIAAILSEAGADPPEFVVARMRAQAGRLLTAAGSISPSGLPIDAKVFREQTAHQNGSYPIIDTTSYRSVTTLLNTGQEESLIGGQVLWEGGTYTVGPVRVPAGGATEIDLSSQLLADVPDRKGRALPADLPNGYFQWTVLRGSHAILARTEARRRGSDDAAGFNCLGCCEEYSFGRIEPDGASFLPGQSRPLVANEYIASCGAIMGPFQPWFALLDVPSPFTWNGSMVGASQPSTNWVYFEGEGERIHPGRCESRPIRYGDGAPVQSIRVTIDHVSLPNDQIRVTLLPFEASGLFTLRLRNPATKDLVQSQTYGGGTYTFAFSPLAAYSEGQEFAEVYAEWRASAGTSPTTTATAAYPYRFKVLGDYLHTRYNTPIEASCPGQPLPICFQAGGCGGISCNAGSPASARSAWILEVLENGSGLHSTLGVMSREFYCGQSCGSSSRFRAVPAPCGKCGSTLVANQSVAISPSNFYLACGDRVFVEGLGVRTVADTGGEVSTRQLDHFAGASGCNDEATLGYLRTFKLFQQ